MNMRKFIRNYFLFAFTLALVGAFSQNTYLRTYVVSVLHIGETPVEQPTPLAGSDSLKVSTSTDIEDPYVTPDDKYHEIMKFDLKTLDDSFSFKSLNLKILNVHPLAIEKAVLIIDGEVVAMAKRQNDYLLFNYINYSFPKWSEGSFTIALDLNDSLESGKVVQLALEKREDFTFLLGDTEYAFGGILPVLSSQLTAVHTL